MQCEGRIAWDGACAWQCAAVAIRKVVPTAPGADEEGLAEERLSQQGRLWEAALAKEAAAADTQGIAAFAAPVVSIRTVPVWRERPERGLAASGRLQGTACEAERVFSRPADFILVAEEAREGTFAASGAQETAQEALPRGDVQSV